MSQLEQNQKKVKVVDKAYGIIIRDGITKDIKTNRIFVYSRLEDAAKEAVKSNGEYVLPVYLVYYINNKEKNPSA